MQVIFYSGPATSINIDACAKSILCTKKKIEKEYRDIGWQIDRGFKIFIFFAGANSAPRGHTDGLTAPLPHPPTPFPPCIMPTTPFPRVKMINRIIWVNQKRKATKRREI
jgi:hypothetical protein